NTEQGSDPALHERRFAIQWDEDNDERILAAVLGVFFHRPEALGKLYAVGERKGCLTLWAAATPSADLAAWQSASAGPAIQDSWPVTTINVYKKTMRTGGRQHEVMDDDHVIRDFPPEHDQLNWLIKLFNLGPSGPVLPW
ncbi:MAG: hypothetical protein ABIR16_08285, partial [Dokdonella sp.]